jgi:hypothetical protein
VVYSSDGVTHHISRYSNRNQDKEGGEGSVAINKAQLRGLITDVLKEADLYSRSAVELLMLTAAVESKLGTYIEQITGPALGIFQMEPNTEGDIWEHYLDYKPGLADIVKGFSGNFINPELDLKANLTYQIIMARIHYLRIPEPLPDADDVEGLARYWKKYYNTHLGKGTVEKAIKSYKELC